MSDPTRPCLTCSGKLHISHETGKLQESCGRCGLELVDGVPVSPPRDADAVTKLRLGFRVETADYEAAVKARAAAAPASAKS